MAELTEARKASRKEAGKYLAACRKEAKLTQKKLADAIGYEFYTTVSHYERGVARIPSELYVDLADALKQDRRSFVMHMMRLNEPHLFQVLFPEDLS